MALDRKIRVNIQLSKAFADPENNSFNVNIIYNIIGADIPTQSLEFLLQPTR